MALEQLSDVVQRCQALPADSYSPEDHDGFAAAGRICIEEGDAAQVLSIVLDEKNQDVVRCLGWNLLPPLVQVLLRDGENAHQCQAVLQQLLQTCRPKELLIGLLEQLEQDDPVSIAASLRLLLAPLQRVLQALGRRKAASLGMSLSSVLDQVSKLPLPATREQEQDDVFLLCRCCSDLSEFVRPFVHEVQQSLNAEARTGTGRSGGPEELRTELLKYCMKTLTHPLLELQLRDPETLAQSPLRRFASDILNSLHAIGESLPRLTFQPLVRRNRVPGFLEEEVCYPREALACLAHLVFVHHLAADVFPAVFSPEFCLRSNMEHVELLLSRTEEVRILKGLELYERSLAQVDDGGLPADLLEIRSFLSVPQNLVKVMTLCPRQELRRRGLKVFQISIDKFDAEAKHKFFQFLLETSNHSGVEGYVIRNMRKQIDSALQPGSTGLWFQGVQLLPLLRRALSLPDGPETDLLQYMDRVMESLNLLRYLVIRDRRNQTGVWTELDRIEESFMKPLRVGVNMSRAHYEKELLVTMETKRKVKEEPLLSVTVGDEKLPSMTSEAQIQALHSALHTFDLMESLLVRIEELTEVKEHH